MLEQYENALYIAFGSRNVQIQNNQIHESYIPKDYDANVIYGKQINLLNKLEYVLSYSDYKLLKSKIEHLYNIPINYRRYYYETELEPLLDSFAIVADEKIINEIKIECQNSYDDLLSFYALFEDTTINNNLHEIKFIIKADNKQLDAIIKTNKLRNVEEVYIIDQRNKSKMDFRIVASIFKNKFLSKFDKFKKAIVKINDEYVEYNEYGATESYITIESDEINIKLDSEGGIENEKFIIAKKLKDNDQDCIKQLLNKLNEMQADENLDTNKKIKIKLVAESLDTLIHFFKVMFNNDTRNTNFLSYKVNKIAEKLARYKGNKEVLIEIISYFYKIDCTNIEIRPFDVNEISNYLKDVIKNTPNTNEQQKNYNDKNHNYNKNNDTNNIVLSKEIFNANCLQSLIYKILSAEANNINANNSDFVHAIRLISDIILNAKKDLNNAPNIVFTSEDIVKIRNEILNTIKQNAPSVYEVIQNNINILFVQLQNYKTCENVEKPYSKAERVAITALVSVVGLGLVGLIGVLLYKLITFIGPHLGVLSAAIGGLVIAGLVIYMINPNIIKAIISKFRSTNQVTNTRPNHESFFPYVEATGFPPDAIAVGVYIIVCAVCYAVYSALKMANFLTLLFYVIINLYYIHLAHVSITSIPSLIKYVVTHWNTSLATVIHASTPLTTTIGISIIFALGAISVIIINKLLSSHQKPVAPTTAQLTNDVKNKFQ